LRSEPWVPCTLDGEQIAPSKPESAWWLPKPPSENALKQSPWRFAPLCDTAKGVDEELRRLVGLNTLDEAPPEAVERLLRDLREQFENDRLPSDPRTSGMARQAFVGLHRMAYERLAKLSSGQYGVADIIGRTGVLCGLGEMLVYRQPGEARHDDGRFAAYTHYFAGKIPFAALLRDKTSVADALGIEKFDLKLTRVGGGDGQDVTDEVREIHADRIPELLAIMTHHSLGAQTLELASDEFGRRANRIRNLRIIQLDKLIVDAIAEGLDVRVEIGAGSNRDLFLENPRSTKPVLFHDFSDDDWRDRLRQKISPYFAAILENPVYAHTFMAFLQSDKSGREEFLHDLGISENDVDAIETGVGVAGEDEWQRRVRWFRAILAVRECEPSNLNREDFASELKNSGLPDGVAHRLVEIGGGEEVRRQIGEGSALRMLHEAGTDLRKLHESLCDAGDDGLTIRVAENAFRRWLGDNGRRLSAVLAAKYSPDSAKAPVRSMEPPDALQFSLDPKLPDLLSPVVEALREAGLAADDHALAEKPAEELARIGGFDTVGELDAKVELLLDDGERKRVLRGRASEWQREIQLLAVLANVGENETPANVRDMDEKVSSKLPGDPSFPAELRDALGELFGEHPALAARIRERLTDSIHATAPNREELMKWAREDGIAVERLDSVKRALDKPKHARAQELKEHAKRLGDMRPVTPSFVPPQPPDGEGDGGGVVEGERDGGGGPREVRTIKIGEGHDRGRREAGDEGERWALAAVVGDLVKLDEEARKDMINKIEEFIRSRFKGSDVDKMLGHAEEARNPGLDDEELIEALSGLLHVSRHSDAFGFDMIGWLSPAPGGERRALCLEVKSSAGEGFHFSQGEWDEAKRLREEYAVLVVRRAKGGGAPVGMHLLPDPVALVKDGLLDKKPDGYQITYQTKES